MQLQSSNPILQPGQNLDSHFGLGQSDQDRMAVRASQASLSGIVNKTGILSAVCIGAGVLGYSLLPQFGSGVVWVSAIASMILCLAFGFIVRGNPRLAMPLSWVFAVVEGIFLGALTGVLDSVLAAQLGTAMVEKLGGSLALPAFAITAGCFFSMLGLYKAGIIRPTQKFKAIMGVAVGGIMLAYLAHFVLMLFGSGMPFLSLSSASGTGMTPLIGLGISAAILLVASLTLIMDFGAAEELVESGAPKQAEWFVAFGLLASLAWIYLEAVKLVFRLAMMFGNRE